MTISPPRPLTLLLLLGLGACGGKDPAADDSATDDSATDDSATDDSATDDSATENTAPSAPGVTVTPDTPFPYEDLRCEVSTPSTDAEGDAITYTYAWTVDVTRCSALHFDGLDDRVATDDITWSTFTVEAWIYTDGAVEFASLVADLNNSGDYIHKNFEVSLRGSQVMISMGSGSSWQNLAATQAVPTHRWVHLAAMYDGADLSVAIDGSVEVLGRASLAQAEWPLWIGGRPRDGEPYGFYRGLIHSVRISDGVRYTSDFTPAGALSADGSTLALWAFDEGQGSRVAVELAPCAALDFDGVDDFVEFADIDWDTFTIEAWIYVDSTSASAYMAVAGDLHNNTASRYHNVELGVRNGRLDFTMGVGDNWAYAIGTRPVPTGQWVHLAVMYDGSSMRLAQDGGRGVGP